MPRVITAIHYDLKFNLSDTPPMIGATFADVDAAGREVHARTLFTDAAASRIVAADGDLFKTLAAINLEIDAQAADVKEPGTVAARIQAASEAKVAQSQAEAIVDAKTAQVASLDAQIAAKRAELAVAVK